jgi:hypothetical protein
VRRTATGRIIAVANGFDKALGATDDTTGMWTLYGEFVSLLARRRSAQGWVANS